MGISLWSLALSTAGKILTAHNTSTEPPFNLKAYPYLRGHMCSIFSLKQNRKRPHPAQFVIVECIICNSHDKKNRRRCGRLVYGPLSGKMWAAWGAQTFNSIWRVFTLLTSCSKLSRTKMDPRQTAEAEHLLQRCFHGKTVSHLVYLLCFPVSEDWHKHDDPVTDALWLPSVTFRWCMPKPH